MALQNLKKYFESENINDFNDMLKLPCVVSEKIQASSFHVKRTKDGFSYYKSGSKNEMNKVDRTLVKYYENAIKYFKSIPAEQMESMPFDWKFGFDYMTENKTIDIEYEFLPKNNLILTHIQVLNPNNPTQIKKVIRDPQILNKWADKLEVNRPPVIFEGTLSGDQKEELVDLLQLHINEFKEQYENFSFTRKMYHIFNNGLNAPALNYNLDREIDGLIVNFYDGKSPKSFKLERFDREQKQERQPSDMYQLSILDLVEFLTSYDLEGVSLTNENADERYLELMSEVFNSYVEKSATKYIGANFNSADFADNKLFELNPTFISNEKTSSLIQNKVLSELFKITLGSFRKKRTKETNIINADLMSQINELVERIEAKIMLKANEQDVMDFKTYLNQQSLQHQTSPILEGLTVKHKKQGKKPVNMFVGRFQPFTLGHAKVIETIYKENGLPVVIFLVKSKKKKAEDAFKRPYDEETQMEMLNKLKSTYPIEDVIILNSGAIDAMFNELRPKYEPVLWGTGTDRMVSYGYQVNKESYREELDCREDFGLFEIKRTGKNISATQVRNAMLDDDVKLFKKLTPPAIHGMYDELQHKLKVSMGQGEEVLESVILTFDDFVKNI